MGNVCQTVAEEPKVHSHRREDFASLVATECGNSKEKGSKEAFEVKEFMTLTSQNTESFYEPMEEQGADAPVVQQKIISDFAMVRGLGRGASGEVYLVRTKDKSTVELTQRSRMR
jgi:hypothetical protein